MLNHFGNQNLVPVVEAQTVSVTTSSAASNATTSKTYGVTLRTTADCFIAVGAAPTASTTVGTSGGYTSFPLFADEWTDVPCQPGDKIAAIHASSTATLYILERGQK